MKMWIYILFCSFLTLCVNGCGRTRKPYVIGNKELFHEAALRGHVKDEIIPEISGIAKSRRHTDVLYVFNDSGGLPRLFALNATTAEKISILNIDGALNCDWEDIAVGVGPYGHFYIYIGDIGGNTKSSCNTIYRIMEPLTLEDEMTLGIHGELHFTWDAPNCETLLVDHTGTLYLVSKVYYGMPKLYKVPTIGWKFSKVHLGPGSNVSIPVNSPTDQAVGGDISKSGAEILIKSYGAVYYWRRSLTSPLAEILQKQPEVLPYKAEPQGEAICWGYNDSGYFTISEGPHQPLYYYKRKKQDL